MNKAYIPHKSDFEGYHNVKKTTLISLHNSKGMRVLITNYGARLVGVLVPDKTGNLTDVNLGFAHIDDYTKEKANYYGAVVGRVCGRIRNSEFLIEDKKYSLEPNGGDNFLHGGENGFHTQVFKVENEKPNSVSLSYWSEDGEEGFPGNLSLKVKYTLTEDNELRLKYEVESDKKTPFNVTNHAFFNLNGEGEGNILEQELQVFTNQYLPIKEDILPTGEFEKTENTPFDFSELKALGKDIKVDNKQIHYANGYDHTFVLNREFTSELKHAAQAKGNKTGIVMDVYTDQPGVHLYTGNFMDGSFPLKSGGKDDFQTAFCLETQHLADALTYDHFPSIILEPNTKFTTQTTFKFK